MTEPMTAKTNYSPPKKRVEVEEIENGFLLVASKEWEDKEGWHYETKKFYYQEDPLKNPEESPDTPKPVWEHF